MGLRYLPDLFLCGCKGSREENISYLLVPAGPPPPHTHSPPRLIALRSFKTLGLQATGPGGIAASRWPVKLDGSCSLEPLPLIPEAKTQPGLEATPSEPRGAFLSCPRHASAG